MGQRKEQNLLETVDENKMVQIKPHTDDRVGSLKEENDIYPSTKITLRLKEVRTQTLRQGAPKR